MAKIRVGLVGCGFVSELHMYAYRRVYGVDVEVTQQRGLIPQPGQSLEGVSPGVSRGDGGDGDAIEATAGEAAPLAGGQLGRVEAEQH